MKKEYNEPEISEGQFLFYICIGLFYMAGLLTGIALMYKANVSNTAILIFTIAVLFTFVINTIIILKGANKE